MKIQLPARGVDLLSDETGLPEGAVRAASNVDIRKDGSFSRRTGYSILSSGANWHSVFNSPSGTLVGVGTKLNLLDTTSYALTELADMGSEELIDFTVFNGHTYAVNRSSAWWIPEGAVSVRRIGVSAPNARPGIFAHPYGALSAGTYAVAISRVDDRGEESPTVFLGTVDLSSGGGVMLSGVPVDANCSYRVYLSAPDSEALYLSEEFSGVLGSFVAGRPADGVTRSTQHLQPMPAGDFVRGHAGRLYVARDNALYFSDPLRPHLHDPRHGFVQFVGEIRFVEPVIAGLFVGDDRGVWFLAGNDAGEFAQRKVSSAVAIKRSSCIVAGAHFKPLVETDADVAVWLSTEGYMIGPPSGDALSIHPDRLRVAASLEGRSRFMVRNGVKQIITLTAATEQRGFGIALDTVLQ